MDEPVGVCFRPTGKVYYFSAPGLRLKPGERVVAETSRGQELAEVVRTGPQGEKTKGKLKPILRRATADDVARGRENRHREEEARRICQRLLKQMRLVVKLVDVEYAFDGAYITFSFASDDKTDFRELHRRLKEIYDCEVEVRQIGVRDQAKILGGLGPCGRHLCCAAFLRNFQPVTIRMAKDQDIALNPTKISGQCGRLMCCLRYEHELYRDARAKLPAVGAEVTTPQGTGEVTAVDALRERVTVATPDGTIQVGLDDLLDVRPKQARKAPEPTPPLEPAAPAGDAGSDPAKKRRRRGARRRSASPTESPDAARATPIGEGKQPEGAHPAAARRRGRRRRPGRSSGSASSQGGAAPAAGGE